MAIQDEGQGQVYQDFFDNFQLEPEAEEPSAEEIESVGVRMWQGDLPDAEVEGSPEGMGHVDGSTACTSYCDELCWRKTCYVQVYGYAWNYERCDSGLWQINVRWGYKSIYNQAKPTNRMSITGHEPWWWCMKWEQCFRCTRSLRTHDQWYSIWTIWMTLSYWILMTMRKTGWAWLGGKVSNDSVKTFQMMQDWKVVTLAGIFTMWRDLVIITESVDGRQMRKLERKAVDVFFDLFHRMVGNLDRYGWQCILPTSLHGG